MTNTKTNTPELTQEMLQKATHYFITHGLRSVNMEEIARELSITKKYLYQLVSTKGELIAKCAKFMTDYLKEQEIEIDKRAKNPIDEIGQINKLMVNDYKCLHPDAFQEIRKYYPTASAIYNDFHFQFNEQFILRNLREGVKEGFYRETIQTPLLTRMYLNTTMSLLLDENYPYDEFSPYPSTRTAFIEVFLLGIVTEKGRKAYYDFFK